MGAWREQRPNDGSQAAGPVDGEARASAGLQEAFWDLAGLKAHGIGVGMLAPHTALSDPLAWWRDPSTYSDWERETQGRRSQQPVASPPPQCPDVGFICLFLSIGSC